MNLWEEVKDPSINEALSEMTSPERLIELAKISERLSLAVARNPKAPEELLTQLAKTGKAPMWVALAENPALPESCFEILYKRGIRSLLRLIASHPKTPQEILERLSRSRRIEVTEAVAKNPSTPENILERLSGHAVTRVYRAAQKNPQSPFYIEGEPSQRWSRNAYPGVVYPVLPAPVVTLRRLVSHPFLIWRMYAARNPSLTPELMLILARDGERMVREALARNPVLSREAIKILAKDADNGVRTSLNNNPAAANIPINLPGSRR